MTSYKHYYLDQIGGSLPGFAGVKFQRGHGLPGFIGVRYQRGHGFFGRLFGGIGSFIKELIPSLGKRALPSAIGLAQDIMSGENVGTAAKMRLKEAGKNIADETLTNIQNRLQKGTGIVHLRRLKPIIKKKQFTKRKVNKRSKSRRRRYF